MPRLFLAMPLPGQVKKQLTVKIGKIKKSLSDWTVNWVAPENLHITLVFFGWVKEEQVKIIKTDIAEAVSGLPAFKIITGKLSVEGRPIWLEIEDGRGKLHKISEALVRKLTIRGSLEEERGFHPHLTLGRMKKRGETKLPSVSETFSWKVSRLVLYESKLSPKGPTYIPRSSFSLG